MKDFADRLVDAMESKGIYIDGRIDWRSDKFQRFRCKSKGGRKTPIYIKLFEGGASFGDWRDESSFGVVWENPNGQLKLEEKRQRALASEHAKHERRLLQAHAVWRAQELLDHQTFLGATCVPASIDHPYVRTKRIYPYYARQIRSYLVLPITDVDGKLQSLQYIKPNGHKQFKKNASPKGGMMWLCQIPKSDFNGTIRICEGYATGCSITECCFDPVVVAFAASNLMEVAIAIWRKYPTAKISICADNDQFTKENIGLMTGRNAALKIKGVLCFPEFREDQMTKKPTDFNDLFCFEGLEGVEKQLQIAR